MGRETSYANQDHRGYTRLSTQPTANENPGVYGGHADPPRNGVIKDGEARPAAGAASGGAANYVNGVSAPKPGFTGVETYRKQSPFDDCGAFVREATSELLGKVELRKFEHNPYRSRYLNTPECEVLLRKHCQRLLNSYYDRTEALSTASCGTKRPTFEDIVEAGLTSSDHMTSIATLAVLARFHRISYLATHMGDPGISVATVHSHVLNVLRVIFSASAAGPEKANSNGVETARRFFSILSSGAWYATLEQGDPFASLDRRLAQRVALLYALCVNLLDVLLSNSCEDAEGLLSSDGTLYAILSSVACCFVEKLICHGHQSGYMPTSKELPDDRMVPNLADPVAMFAMHFSLLNALLAHGVKFNNTYLLEKGVKALCLALEKADSGRSLLLWVYCAYVRLCSGELAKSRHAIPRLLFSYMTRCNSVLQLRAVTGVLAFCLRDQAFVDYVADHMNTENIYPIFVLHACNLIHKQRDDLAVPLLQMLHLLFNLCPNTLPVIANTMTGTPGMLKEYSKSLPNAVETFLNVALLSLGPIQVIMAVIMRRILLTSDVTKSLDREKFDTFVSHLLAAVGFKKGSGPAVADADGLVTKVALFEAFVQAGRLPDLVQHMKNVTAKDLRLMTLPSAAASRESLHKLLCVGDIATKLVAYDALVGYKPDGMDAGTLVACALCSAVKMCPDVLGILREYAATYARMREYHGTRSLAGEGKFLRALGGGSGLADPTRSARVAGLLSVHAAIASLYMASEPCKQNLIHSLLCPEGAPDERLRQELVEKYKAQLAAQRKEVLKSQSRLDAQANELQQYKAAAAKQLEQLTKEYSEQAERARAELVGVQAQLGSATSQAQQLDRDCARLRTQVGELDQALRKLSAENEQAADNLRAAASHRERLKAEVAGLKGQLEQRDRTLESLRTVESDNGRLTKEVDELNAQVERVYRMLISLMSKHRQLEGDLTRSREEAAQSGRQLQERQAQVDELSGRCRAQEGTIAALRTAKEGAEEDVQRLRRELQGLEARLSKSNDDLKLLQSRHSATSQTLQACEEQNRRLTEQLQSCEAQLRQRGEQLSTIYSTFQDKRPY
ncbi:patched family protein [Babesia caballi]|uniref:Patched family protein n=1 Tax=Babesia caballi TaxID=5871 RepID=A0AAV4LUH5_BABCB|nr:patched family protein [Babesia caballi]